MKDSRQVVLLKLDDILPNRFQPRIKFDEKAIVDLSESIKEHGVIQPIIVRRVSDKFEIIAGERRYKASVMAGKSTIPAIIVDLNDKDSSEIALIENIQRQDLTPIEEAISYRKILDMGYLTQEALAAKLGVAQPTIANKLRLLNLDDEVQEALLDGKISERHARSLLKLPNSSLQREVLNKIITEKMTVRRTDEVIDNMTKKNDSSVFDSLENNTINTFEESTNINQNLNNEDVYSNDKSDDVPPSINVEVLDFGFEEPTSTPNISSEQIPSNPIVQDVDPVNSFNQNIVQPVILDNSYIEQPINNQMSVEPQAPTNIEPQTMSTEANVETDNIVVDEFQHPTPRFFTMVSPDYQTEMPEQPVSTPEPEPINYNNVNVDNNSSNNNIIYEQPSIPDNSVNTNIFNTQIIPEPMVPEVPQPVSVVEPVPQVMTPVEPEVIQMEEPKPVEPVIPVIPQNEPVAQMTLIDVINKIRKSADEIEAMGFEIDTEEFDFDDIYQVIFKIKK